MPRATVGTEDQEKHDLKTCPPDGFVLLRRMSYGERLRRDQMMTVMKVESGRKNRDRMGIIESAGAKVTAYEFNLCIVDHNLEDESGNKLNLGSAAHIERLDPRIGAEISKHIDEMNGFGDEDDEDEEGGVPNSQNGSATVSSESKKLPTPS